MLVHSLATLGYHLPGRSPLSASGLGSPLVLLGLMFWEGFALVFFVCLLSRFLSKRYERTIKYCYYYLEF